MCMMRGSLLGRDPSGARSVLALTVRGAWSARWRCLPRTACLSRAQISWPWPRAPCLHLPSQTFGNSSSRSSTSSRLFQQWLLQHSAMHTTAATVGQQDTHRRAAHTHMCARTHTTRTHTHTNAHTHTNTNAHTHIHMHAHKHTDTRTSTNTHAQAHRHTHTYTHMHARTHTYTHTCICTHTFCV